MAILRLRYPDLAALQADFEANLRKGRAFVGGVQLTGQREACTIVIEHPVSRSELQLAAEAVWVNPDPAALGTGVQFADFGEAERERLRAFVAASSTQRDEPASSVHHDGPASSAATSDVAASSGTLPTAPRSTTLQVAPGSELDDDGEESDPASSSPVARNLHDRVRGLDSTERDALARSGSLPERVALERRFGSSVWEGLLHNPQITPREVLRMAKSTSLPTALVNLIVANKAWLADPAIQTALLHNPRVSGAHIERVLRALPQAQLSTLAEQTSVRMQVRSAAKRLIRR